MDRIIDVADFIVRRYKEITGEDLDGLKLQKLLYFTQREAFAILGHAAFDGTFEGWKYGPVCREVYNAYQVNRICAETHDISSEIQYIANNVILGYGSFESWKLSQISHNDISWRNARRGLKPGENGYVPLSNEDIKKDAANVRPYDHIWDMYYDEFDDAEVDDG